ncbi:MAG TPA: hypothetical protein VE712_01080 [Actinomycetota bacterium]|nr:hypothetical protein [Actinomycetota bacterium]
MHEGEGGARDPLLDPEGDRTPCTKTVFPVPRSPLKLMTSPGRSMGARAAPTILVSSAEVVTTASFFGMHPL